MCRVRQEAVLAESDRRPVLSPRGGPLLQAWKEALNDGPERRFPVSTELENRSSVPSQGGGTQC